MDKKLSIIIPTFNRDELLSIGLESLSKQTIFKETEVLVINDGTTDVTPITSKYSNIKLINTNKRGDVWQTPVKTLNLGLRLSSCDKVVVTCPEIYWMDKDILDWFYKECRHKRIIHTEGYDDIKGNVLENLKKGNTLIRFSIIRTLNTHLPFAMCFFKADLIAVNGWDEDYLDLHGHDDNDLMDKLIVYGCELIKLNKKVIHLFHSREGHNAEIVEKGKEIYKEKKRSRHYGG